MKLRDSEDCLVVLTEHAAFWLIIIYDGSDILLTCNSSNTTSRATLPISAKAHNEKLMQFYKVFDEVKAMYLNRMPFMIMLMGVAGGSGGGAE